MSVALTPDQRARFLESLRNGEHGYALALRRAGVPGSKGELKALLADDPELSDDAKDAQRGYLESLGLSPAALLANIAKIATDTTHPQTLKANVYALSWHGIHVTGERTQVEHSGPDGAPMEVNNPDVAAALERFTSQVVRLAARARADEDPRQLEPGAAGGAGLQVVRVVGETEPV
jgi:hypothetical protein